MKRHLIFLSGYFFMILLNICAILMLVKEINKLKRKKFSDFDSKYYTTKLIRSKENVINSEINNLTDFVWILFKNITILIGSMIIFILILDDLILKNSLIYKITGFLVCVSYFFYYFYECTFSFFIKLLLFSIIFYFSRNFVVPQSNTHFNYFYIFLELFFTSIFMIYFEFMIFLVNLVMKKERGNIPLVPYLISKIYFDKIYFYESKNEIVIFNFTFFNFRRLFFIGNFTQFNEKELISLILHEAGHTGLKDGRVIITFFGVIYSAIIVLILYLLDQNSKKKKLKILFFLICYPLAHNLTKLISNICIIKLEEMSNNLIFSSHFTKFFIDAQFKGNVYNKIPNNLPYLVNILLFDHPSLLKLIKYLKIK
ncbi:hypothetical protein TUBRATIS_11340 [Tubulinosema ratisbonensis]|uniref:Uncharacterized protein n=1 Tax=Tubulinosema ratisbonensis TaxID=291195 RepID=A0A437AMQ1_9MICR|nr:hypothetical protein TUBRATIS_11340 [Tubulinosema ratisbonensis]